MNWPAGQCGDFSLLVGSAKEAPLSTTNSWERACSTRHQTVVWWKTKWAEQIVHEILQTWLSLMSSESPQLLWLAQKARKRRAKLSLRVSCVWGRSPANTWFFLKGQVAGPREPGENPMQCKEKALYWDKAARLGTCTPLEEAAKLMGAAFTTGWPLALPARASFHVINPARQLALL